MVQLEHIEAIEKRLWNAADTLRDNATMTHEMNKTARDMTNNIPPGWVMTTIGDVFEFVGGGTPTKKNTHYWNGNIPWATVKDIKGRHLYDAEDHITDDGLKNSAANLSINGTTVLEIRLNILQKIPIPPLPEQHRIVTKIEQLFSELDKGVAELKKAKEKLELYRQSLLKAAFEGRLTEQWRKEHLSAVSAQAGEPASELLKRTKAEREKAAQVGATVRSPRTRRRRR